MSNLCEDLNYDVVVIGAEKNDTGTADYMTYVWGFACIRIFLRRKHEE